MYVGIKYNAPPKAQTPIIAQATLTANSIEANWREVAMQPTEGASSSAA
ncbi:hypothetical protein KCQ_16462 [Pectobacterium atrosepticum ICMP 1526]|nr:hypothetical protein KCQ_16462 [Pectobacterium atrosepticum ICMP 1526]